jgi:hypothetical protein
MKAIATRWSIFLEIRPPASQLTNIRLVLHIRVVNRQWHANPVRPKYLSVIFFPDISRTFTLSFVPPGSPRVFGESKAGVAKKRKNGAHDHFIKHRNDPCCPALDGRGDGAANSFSLRQLSWEPLPFLPLFSSQQASSRQRSFWEPQAF